MATPTSHIAPAEKPAATNPAIYPSHIQERPTPNDPSKMKQPLQMTDISEYTKNDVLCGRGGAVLRHPGNVQYQNLIKERQTEYTTCLKAEKLHISRSIVEKVRNEFGGRFLVKQKSLLWNDIGDKKAIEKTSQALREGQPKRWETIRLAKAKAAGIVTKGSKNGSDDNESVHSDDASQATHRSRASAFLKGLSKELHPSDISKSKKRKEARSKKKKPHKNKYEGSSQQQTSTSSLSYASSNPSKRTVYSADTITSSNASLSVQRTISSSMASMSTVNAPTISSSMASMSTVNPPTISSSMASMSTVNPPTITSSNASLSVQHTISSMSVNPTIASSNASLSVQHTVSSMTVNPTITSSNASLSVQSSTTGDSWGPSNYDRQDSNCSTLVTGNLDNQGRVEKIEYLLPRRTSDFTVELTDAELMHLGEIPEYNDESHILPPEGSHHNYNKNTQSFRSRMSHKSRSRGSINTYSSSDRGAQSLLSDFSAIGSKMSIMTIEDSTDSSSREQIRIKPVAIWNANESGMPIEIPNDVTNYKPQQQHKQQQSQSHSQKIDRRKLFANLKGKKRNRSNDSRSKPPLSTVVLNSDSSESKEQASNGGHYRGSSYKDSLGSFNLDSTNLRASFQSKSIGTSNHGKINQSTRSGMSALTMMSADSIGTSIDLLSVCEALQSSSKSDINGSSSSGSKDPLHEMMTWNSNRSGFSGPPISILTPAGPPEVNEDTWVSKNTAFSKDSLFSTSSNSKGSHSQFRRYPEGKPPVGAIVPKASRRNSIKSMRSNMSKGLSDLSMGTGLNTSNLSISSFILDEIEDMPLIEDNLGTQYSLEMHNGTKHKRTPLPTIDGSKTDFDFSMEMDVD